MVSQIHTHISEVFNSDWRNVQKVVPSLVQKKKHLAGSTSTGQQQHVRFECE